MRKLKLFSKKKITLDEIIELYDIEDYKELAELIKNLMDSGQLKAVKGSPLNGKKPPLATRYHVLVKQETSDYQREMMTSLHPKIQLDYYLTHKKKYEEDREMLFRLSRYLTEQPERLKTKISVKERSFEIFGQEKYLSTHGKSLLRNSGLSMEILNVYGTTEPLAYYSVSDKSPQNLLILENMDTFYSIRMAMKQGKSVILGTKIDTVIYGKGKAILKSLSDIDNCVEEYLKDDKNTIYYFGDLDYEGIRIFEGLEAEYGHSFDFRLMSEAYIRMLKKSKKLLFPLPETKEGQVDLIGTTFLKCFSEEDENDILNILASKRYIPQEILNIQDF